MAFTINCTHCNCLVSAPDLLPGQSYAGKKGRCLSCGNIVELGSTAGVEDYDLQDVTRAQSNTPGAKAHVDPRAAAVPALSAVPAPAVVGAARVADDVPKPVIEAAPPPVRLKPPVIVNQLELQRAAPIVAPRTRRRSGMKVFLIVLGLLFLLCGGGVTIAAIYLWPRFAQMGDAARSVTAQVTVTMLCAAETNHFAKHREFSATLDGLREELGGDADKLIAEEAAGRQPLAGYYFKVLKSQGPSAPGGAKTFFDAQGRMTQGCAILAYPADMTKPSNTIFIGSIDGRVHSLDVAPTLADDVRKLETYDPNPNWRKLQ